MNIQHLEVVAFRSKRGSKTGRERGLAERCWSGSEANL